MTSDSTGIQNPRPKEKSGTNIFPGSHFFMRTITFVLFSFLAPDAIGGKIPNSRSDIWMDCVAPAKNFRAFVITRAVHAPERGAWELYPPGGDTEDLIDCSQNWYGSIDVIKGQPKGVAFRFKNKETCDRALTKMKSATKEFPVVIVVDKRCEAHLAD